MSKRAPIIIVAGKMLGEAQEWAIEHGCSFTIAYGLLLWSLPETATLDKGIYSNITYIEFEGELAVLRVEVSANAYETEVSLLEHGN